MEYGLIISAILHYFQRKSRALLACPRPNKNNTPADRPSGRPTDRYMYPDAHWMLGCITSHAYLRLRSGIVTQVETKLNPSRLDSLICTSR